MLPVQKNDRLDVHIHDLTHEGAGVARVDGYTLFVPNALPGETVEIVVTKTNKQYGFARLIDVKQASADRVEPPCPIFYQCGGCQLQHFSYDGQLRQKRDRVVDALKRLGQFDVPVHETIGMPEPWRYRNKAQVPFKDEAGRLVAGFYRPRSHDIVEMKECLIQDERNDEAVQVVRDVLAAHGVPAYDEKTGRGVIRHVMARYGYHSGELMIVLITKTTKIKGVNEIVADILKRLPDVTSIMQNINPDKTNVILGSTNKLLYGHETIEDKIGGLTFTISPHSFFQVNPVQTEKLYGKALEYAQLTGTEQVVDAYCGIGTISLFLARKAAHVYGVEVVPEAIEDAKQNALVNEIDNVTYACGAAEDVLPQWKKDGINPDVIVVDPPRKGCAESFLETMVEMAPKRIVYVSCNVATQARDMRYLADRGYRLVEVTPVDMFPHTAHVETVAWMEKIEE
ncbi:23S rRNA (uracil(1939)-C(5))-methyltransferase RlmD [Exiguobacterium aurantiacum]|uniref:23S rRNA (uracil(1939)-C(5))-methyltransferase RlmD n=1 Tax=Exiguobacterium aurantiacum TaxID=33987 RepID=UPI00384ECBEE